MRAKSKTVICFVAALAAASLAFGQQAGGTLSFTVSMPEPSNHLYHVVLHCEGLHGAAQDFKMPVWTPGYYGIQNFAQSVENFRAEDGSGNPLSWVKTPTNAWHVQTGPATSITVSYDVRATRSFVGTSYLDTTRGYIMPAGVCMYVAGMIQHPVTLTIDLNPNWSTIATGLDPVAPDKPHTYAAPDFDILYDSPILMGNLESLPSFTIQGVRHEFFGYNIGITNRQEFMDHLKAVVAAGVTIIGEIPYNHYTFIAIGPGGGGIEHLNSTSFGFSGGSAGTRSGMIRQLDFLAHEYFHNYNVKRIRPIELGPFNYDRENRTRMLWVSEGLTSYYEYLMLSRSGNMTQEELLNSYTREIVAYENNSGHLFQSLAQASYDTWSQGSFGGGRRGGGGLRKTISYYNKGPALGLLLDFKIRHETKNRKSLDTVMRTLYQKYYKELKRGWTEDEFRKVCEDTAGCSLKEFFGFVNTTGPVDYNKYLAYAGLELEKPKELPAADLGAYVEEKDGKLVIAAVEWGSAANLARLAAADEIKTVDGAKVDAKSLNDAVAGRKPGDKLKLTIVRDGRERAVEVKLGHKLEKSFRIVPIAKPDALQAEILRSWCNG